MSSFDVSASASIGAGGIGISAGIGLGGGPGSPELETDTQFLYTAFNFAVEIDVHGVSGQVCNGAFAECDGLELTHELKTIREGGNNRAQIRLSGPASFGTVTLKRGMTPNFNLWQWFDSVVSNPALRAHGEVVIFTRA
ncbi:MAG: hypothetical protein QOH95_2886, partial [Gaiellaceae bacterium]|nr:hypothetical protein [Gaiellaceae bacterium]